MPLLDGCERGVDVVELAVCAALDRDEHFSVLNEL